MKDFHRRLVPAHGLDKVIVSEKLMKSLKEIVQFEKARLGFQSHQKLYTSFIQ